MQPYVEKYNFDLFTVLVDYMGEPYIKKDIPREIKITVFDNGITKHQDFLSATVYTSEGIELLSGKRFNAPLQNTYGYNVCHTLRFTAVDFPTEYCELLINFRLLGRHTNETVRIALFPGVE